MDLRYSTALASIKMVKEASLLALEESDYEFLTQENPWVSTDRGRARRCVEAATFGALDFVGFPRVEAPAEFIAGVIAYYVHPMNMQSACLIMEGAEWSENTINGTSRPVKSNELFCHVLRVRAGYLGSVDGADKALATEVKLGV
jgi:hypothetical protein